MISRRKKNAPQRLLGTNSDLHALPSAEKKTLKKYLFPDTFAQTDTGRHMLTAREHKDWALVVSFFVALFRKISNWSP